MSLRPQQIHDKSAIEGYLRQDIYLHLYALGDLDDFFWPHTEWYGLAESGSIRAIWMRYGAVSPPVLLALSTIENLAHSRRLLAGSIDLLQPPLYAHVSPGLEKLFHRHYAVQSHGTHLKMALRLPEKAASVDTHDTIPLTNENLNEIVALYEHSYPGHAFDPRMLETGQCFCMRKNGRIISAAGVHVYSRSYRVAAIGNVVTHPEFRQRGYGTRVTAGAVRSLLKTVDHIGLNVKADNAAAVRSYRKLGFEVHTRYTELTALSRME